jgi:hypothetical protein
LAGGFDVFGDAAVGEDGEVIDVAGDAAFDGASVELVFDLNEGAGGDGSVVAAVEAATDAASVRDAHLFLPVGGAFFGVEVFGEDGVAIVGVGIDREVFRDFFTEFALKAWLEDKFEFAAVLAGVHKEERGDDLVTGWLSRSKNPPGDGNSGNSFDSEIRVFTNGFTEKKLGDVVKSST